jgi:hypothetical protein
MSGRRTSIWRSGILALIVATTGACISGARYPTTWTKRVPVAKGVCPDVSGVFSNRGDVHPRDVDASLNAFLRSGTPLLAVTQVEITQSDRFLEISLWSEEKVSERLRLDRGVGFECGADGLELLQMGHSESDAAVSVGALFSWGKVWMTKGEDGSLVVRTVDSDLFFLILIPLYGRETLWFRFPAVAGGGPRQDRAIAVDDATAMTGVDAGAHGSLDEIITKTIEASGGRDAWKAVESARITGRMVIPLDTKQRSFSLEVKRPNKWRREVSLKGKTEITTCDGEKGWILPAKRAKAVPSDLRTISLIGLEAPFFGPLLLDQGNERHNIELVGAETIDGTAAIKIKVTRDIDDMDDIYVDAERFLVFRLDRRTRIPALWGPMSGVRQMLVGNYKRVGTLMFPHTLVMRENARETLSTVTIDKVELNPSIGDDRFAMPTREPMQR